VARGRGSSPLSRAVHRVDRVTSRPATAAAVSVLIVAFAVALAIAGFPETWETAFAAACAGVTTIMVFTTQLKLDELIRALPGADDHLVHVEAGPDAELAELEQRQVEHHLSIRADE